MMDKTLLERIWAGIVGFSGRLADGVAQLTNWQFILLGLLALIGANILASILDSRPAKHLAPPTTVAVIEEKPQPADKEAAPAVPEPPTPARDLKEESLKQEMPKDIQKELDSDSVNSRIGLRTRLSSVAVTMTVYLSWACR